jgi:hypothetical protein
MLRPYQCRTRAQRFRRNFFLRRSFHDLPGRMQTWVIDVTLRHLPVYRDRPGINGSSSNKDLFVSAPILIEYYLIVMAVWITYYHYGG